MAGEGAEQADHPGWLAGLPVTIKDLTDVAGVRTTYGSPIFRDHVPTVSHPLVQRIERLGGIVIGKSNTPEFGAGGSTFNEVFGRTRNPWNTALTCGGSTGGGAVSVATGEAWLAHGTDHAGSLRRPGTYCSVVGLRPSPGRVTRGTPNNLFSPLSVHGPMGRCVADVALFLDTMAGWDIRDPLTYEAPATPYAASLAPRPLRVAFTADFNGALPVDRETRAICDAAVRRFAEAGCTVEDAAPDLAALQDAFLILRSQHFVVDREQQLQTHRDLLKPDIIWNTERGLAATPSQLAWAERERAAWYRRLAEFFGRFDVLVTPGAATPAFDVMLRHPDSVAGRKLENYMAASMLNAAITLGAARRWRCPAASTSMAGRSGCRSPRRRGRTRSPCGPPRCSKASPGWTGWSRSTRAPAWCRRWRDRPGWAKAGAARRRSPARSDAQAFLTEFEAQRTGIIRCSYGVPGHIT